MINGLGCLLSSNRMLASAAAAAVDDDASSEPQHLPAAVARHSCCFSHAAAIDDGSVTMTALFVERKRIVSKMTKDVRELPSKDNKKKNLLGGRSHDKPAGTCSSWSGRALRCNAASIINSPPVGNELGGKVG
jgi:hypothetical protein